MPDMTKQDPESQGSSTDAPQSGACPDCGHDHEEHALVPGSRSWFWSKRLEHVMLWLAPGGPLLMGAMQLWHPQVNVHLDGEEREAINRVYEMHGAGASTVRDVSVRLDDPSIADRLIAAGPSLLFGALLVFVAYALWRIEINLSATGRYTPKDGRVLSAASRWLWRGWWFLIAAEIGVSLWWRDVPASGDWFTRSVGTPFDHASLMTLMITAVVAIIARIYRNGARAYAELEKGV